MPPTLIINDEEDESQLETVPKPPKKRYCFLTLFQWCALICFVLLGIILALAFTVISPAIASSIVEGASLDFTELSITDPLSTSFSVTAAGVIRNAGPFDGSIAPADFYVKYNSQLLGRMPMPEIAVIGGQDSPFEVSSAFEILDRSVFDTMTKDLINEPEIVWEIEAVVSLKAKIAGIKFSFSDIEFSKQVAIPGANGLGNVTLLVFDLTESTPTTIHVELMVSLENPSIVNISPLGDISFYIRYKGSNLGIVVSPNAELSVGQNTLMMAGDLNPDDITIAEELFNRFLIGLETTVEAVATENASTVELFNEALQGLSLETELFGIDQPVLAALNFTYLNLIPVNNSHVSMAVGGLVTVYNPLGSNSPINILTTSMFISLFDGDQLLGSMNIPSTQVINGSQPIVFVPLQGSLIFKDSGISFSRFVQKFLKEPKVTISAKGTADVVAITALGKLNLTGIPIDTNSTLDGVNNFPEVNILNFDLPRNYPTGGIELQLQTSLLNPSVGSLQLGELTLDLYYETSRIGTVFAKDVTFVPGQNVLSLIGYILADDVDEASKFFTLYFTGVDTPVSVQGVDAGRSPIFWVQDVVRSLRLGTIFPGFDDILIKGLDLQSLGIFFPGGTRSPEVSSEVVAFCNIPFGFPLNVWQVSAYISLWEEGNKTLEFLVPNSFSTYDQPLGKLVFPFERVISRILAPQSFSNLIEKILLSQTLSIDLQGTSIVTGDTAAGNLTLRDIPFKDSVSLPGLNSFLDPPISIQFLDVVGGTPGKVSLRLDIVIQNPSIIYGKLGDFSLDLYSQGENIGISIIKNFDLGLGQLTLEGTQAYLQDNGAGSRSRSVLTDYLEGRDSPVELYGVPNSASVTYLNQAISKLVTKTVLPGLKDKLIMEALINAVKTAANILNPFQNPKIAPTRLVIYNPFSVSFSITRTNFMIYKSDGGTQIGKFVDDTDIVIQPRGQTTTDEQDVVLAGLSLQLAIAILEALLGGTELDIVGEMDIAIEGFSTTLSYTQLRVKSRAV